MREVGDLISRAVVQKMIQAAITKRLPVFAGSDEGVVFTVLFSFPRTPRTMIANAILSAAYKRKKDFLRTSKEFYYN